MKVYLDKALPCWDDMECIMPYGIQRIHMQNELPEMGCNVVIECAIVVILQI
jgi:hypothetical protein